MLISNWLQMKYNSILNRANDDDVITAANIIWKKYKTNMEKG